MVNDRWIEKFKREALPLIDKNIRPVRVLLFGSRVIGNAIEESDLDVIIISNIFRGVPFIKRMPMVLKIARFSKHIDYLCYTPEEFERIKDNSSLIKDAISHCAEITI